MKLLLDTSPLVALRRGDAKAQRALESRKDSADGIGVSRLTQYELLAGASYLRRRHNDTREFAWVSDLFAWLDVYDLDEEVVRSAAEVQGDAMKAGRQRRDMDLLVAVSAKSGSELLTLETDQAAMGEALKARGITVSRP